MHVRLLDVGSVWIYLILAARTCTAAQTACLPSSTGSQDVINDLFRNGELPDTNG